MALNKKQAKILRLVKEVSATYIDDPVGWIAKFIDFTGLRLDGITEQQSEIAVHLVLDKRVCVSAGGGIGKSAIAALICLWFLATHPFSRIPTTAPSSNLLKDVLWAEISFWLRRCKLSSIFELKDKRLEIKEFGKDWYATARTVPKDAQYISDTMAGFHAGFLLFLVDEASGVPDPVYTAIEGAMTQDESYTLLISNPVSVGGYYFDTIHDPHGKGKSYKVLFYDSRQSPLVDAAYEKNIIARYGKDHPMYRAKVCGLPLESSDSVIVTPAQFDEVLANNRAVHEGDIAIGLDVGGETGADSSIFCHKQGLSIVKWEEFPKVDEDFLFEHCLFLAEKLYKDRRVFIVPDCVGIGAGLYSRLRNSGRVNVIEFIGSKKETRIEEWEKRYSGRPVRGRPQKPPIKFLNRRAEGYFHLQKLFPALHLVAKPPERLKKELANLVFTFDGPMALEDKKMWKKRMGFSPDYADSIMLACWPDISSGAATTAIVPPSTQKIMHSLMMKPHPKNKYGKYGKFVI
jgi:hypothetical protein